MIKHINLGFYNSQFINNINEIVDAVNSQDKIIKSLTEILIKNNLITINEINEMVDSINVMEKLTGE